MMSWGVFWLLVSMAAAQPQHPGQQHIFQYPVTTTRMLIPYELFKKTTGRFFDQVFTWLGLHPYPETVARPAEVPESFRMGLSAMPRYGAQGMTVSCAGCHVGTIFGKTVIGMSNRFPRTNRFFSIGKKGALLMNAIRFDEFFPMSSGEKKMLQDLERSVKRIGIRTPQTLGLDTSLAQVSLSLAHRNADEWATFNPEFEQSPRKSYFDHGVGDSKPAVWWNLKYKTRWLSDGSIISGNPVTTNFLWNEIGRGADLHELGQWLADNRKVVDDLKDFVFSVKAPHWTDFFPPTSIRLTKAKEGEKLFLKSCSGCHGVYQKNWSRVDAATLSAVDLLKTEKVFYKTPTEVKNVGTDSHRYKAMRELAQRLNPLAISKQNQIEIVPQNGYVPPPLEGIAVRFPYFHNNSVPTLCDVLSDPAARPLVYYAREVKDPDRDFDSECVGYPAVVQTPAHRYDTRRPGLGNQGHNMAKGLTFDQKMNIIEFLKTL